VNFWFLCCGVRRRSNTPCEVRQGLECPALIWISSCLSTFPSRRSPNRNGQRQTRTEDESLIPPHGEFRAWVVEEMKRERKNTDRHRRKNISSSDGVGLCLSVSPRDLPAVLAANGALSLLNLCSYLLDRQLKAQADAFEKEGGFTERLYRRRIERRNRRND